MVRACEFCRRRKIRCDTIKPTCTTCRKSNRSCVYRHGVQKQRPSAALIDSLKGEKAALEDALGRLKSADDAQRHVLLQSVTVQDGRVSLSDPGTISTTSSSQGRYPASVNQRRQQMQIQLLSDPGCAQPAPRTREAIAEDTNGEINDNNHDNDGQDMEHANDVAMSSSEEEGAGAMGEPKLTNRSHPARDSIFSSTSVIRLSSPIRVIGLDTPSHEQPAASSELLRYQLIANAATERQREHRLRCLTSIRGIPAELAFHLLDLHWSRQHHTFLLTYRPAFMRELVNGGSYCSDLLLYAVFACSSKFSERLEVRDDPTDPETAGQRFFTRCDELLLREGLLIQSQIPTVIALIMLGSTFIARGMTSKGWLYTGYALRMVYDLGLHVDLQQVNNHNAEEVEIRRRVFWGAFICEKLQSLYLGRPPTISLGDAHVSQDFMDTFEELEPWQPYDDPMTPAASRKVTSSAAPSAYSVTVFQQLCLLSEIMSRIVNKIYFVGATARKTLNEIGPLDDLLTAWYRDLPAHLAYEPWTKDVMDPPVVVAPNRIILLTTYHSLVVLLHRPFIATPKSGASNGSGADNTIKTSAFSWKRCTTAARHITSLALSYQSIYPLRKSSYLLSYAVYVACTIHVLNAASLSTGSDSNAYAESLLLLGASLRCLDELAVPNSGVADTARIIRKLMAAKGVQESPTPVEFQASAPDQTFDNIWQFSNASPTYDNLAQMQPFQDMCIPGQDLLFGFMNENMSFATFGVDDTSF
ncbi:hypothetical protein PENARI_c001G02737 [Penicillium arizonense]|uniref:Zn(2)-C6 fungal-type domain-containing protein n=1 Tax=Penicillium arizonense TaxID=1835702 RepID=A0A1F5LZ80_PENAI|nr:hypothetical protein PENARI_c001G02737 [Penicillium arizonense]OGE58415.1 hypothetical protein PENARI_c001G02737 [Penicillium arizonense]